MCDSELEECTENCPKEESWVHCPPSHFLSPTHWLWFRDASQRAWQYVPWVI